MLDICELILEDHETFRRRFAELDDVRARGGGPGIDSLSTIWRPLADLLEVHAASEEELFYPRLLQQGDRGDEETRDALHDHNDIREAVRAADQAAPGTAEWWDAVLAARASNSEHLAEEERGALPDFRQNANDDERATLGERWLEYESRHRSRRQVDERTKDTDRYIAEHR